MKDKSNEMKGAPVASHKRFLVPYRPKPTSHVVFSRSYRQTTVTVTIAIKTIKTENPSSIPLRFHQSCVGSG